MTEPDNIMEVYDLTFEEDVLNAELPVLVDFWAEWCPPCRELKPVFKELSADYEGEVLFATYKVSEAKGERWGPTAKGYKLKCIPTLILFREGEPAARLAIDSDDDITRDFLDAKVKGMLED